MGGEVIPNLASSTAARLAFRTNRFQKCVGAVLLRFRVCCGPYW